MRMTVEELRRDMLRDMEEKLRDAVDKLPLPDEVRDAMFQQYRRWLLEEALPPDTRLFLAPPSGRAC